MPVIITAAEHRLRRSSASRGPRELFILGHLGPKMAQDEQRCFLRCLASSGDRPSKGIGEVRGGEVAVSGKMAKVAKMTNVFTIRVI